MSYHLSFNQDFVHLMFMYQSFLFEFASTFCTYSKHTITRPYKKRTFPSKALQEKGTIVQKSHHLSSTKGRSRSVHNVYATIDDQCDRSGIAEKKRRVSTYRAPDCASRCNLYFNVVYSSIKHGF